MQKFDRSTDTEPTPCGLHCMPNVFFAKWPPRRWRSCSWLKNDFTKVCLALDLGIRLCRYVLFVALLPFHLFPVTVYTMYNIYILYNIHTTLYNFINNSLLYFISKLVYPFISNMWRHCCHLPPKAVIFSCLSSMCDRRLEDMVGTLCRIFLDQASESSL